MRRTYTYKGNDVTQKCIVSKDVNLHFFNTILVLKALPGLNLFLAVEEVLCDSLAL